MATVYADMMIYLCDYTQELADLLRDLPGKTRVNLLPYNDTGHPTFKPSTTEAITVSTYTRPLNDHPSTRTTIGMMLYHC
jgi:adenine C2-methylase RlmN of 23S rRNA A2503 and tRNA A37